MWFFDELNYLFHLEWIDFTSKLMNIGSFECTFSHFIDKSDFKNSNKFNVDTFGLFDNFKIDCNQFEVVYQRKKNSETIIKIFEYFVYFVKHKTTSAKCIWKGLVYLCQSKWNVKQRILVCATCFSEKKSEHWHGFEWNQIKNRQINVTQGENCSVLCTQCSDMNVLAAIFEPVGTLLSINFLIPITISKHLYKC